MKAFSLKKIILGVLVAHVFANAEITERVWMASGLGFQSISQTNLWFDETGLDAELNPQYKDTESTAAQWMLALKWGMYSTDAYMDINTEFPGWFLMNLFMDNGEVKDGDPDANKKMTYNDVNMFEWILGVPFFEGIPLYLGGQAGFGSTGGYYESQKKGDFYSVDGWVNYGLNASFGFELGGQLFWSTVLYDWMYPSGNALRVRVEYFPFDPDDNMSFSHIQLIFKMFDDEGRKDYHPDFSSTTVGVMIYFSGLY